MRKLAAIPQIVLLLGMMTAAFYLLARTIFLWYAQYNVLDKTLAFLLLVSESYIMFHAFGYAFGIFRINLRGKPLIQPVKLTEYPSVAILIATMNEPKEILERTIVSCFSLDYPNKTIHILDDSNKEPYVSDNAGIAVRYGTKHFHRKVCRGAKAGCINDYLPYLEEKYIILFDVDQSPTTNFAMNVVSIIESDPKLALVQTPQFYSNVENSRIAFASNMQQVVFYEYICESKGTAQAMMCCGTNVIIRRSALLDVGMFEERTVTEDFATTFKMHIKGWKTAYYNHVYTFGMGPEDLGAYFKQQNRWAVGNVDIFKKTVKKFLTAPWTLSPIQWWEYLISSTYYSICWAYAFLFFCIIIFILFNVPSFFMDPAVYVLTFVPYFGFSMGIFYWSLRRRGYSVRQVLLSQLLFFVTLPVYQRATFLGFMGAKVTFQVTSKEGLAHLPYRALWPQLSMWAIFLVTMTWGLNKFACELSAHQLLNVGWMVINFLQISSIFYFNEEEASRKYCKMLARGVKYEYEVIDDTMGIKDLRGHEWKGRIAIFTAEQYAPGSPLICKVRLTGGDILVFECMVIWSAERPQREGFETQVGIHAVDPQDLKKLESVTV